MFFDLYKKQDYDKTYLQGILFQGGMWMLEIAVCDDSRTDIELLEKALDGFRQYPVNYDVFFSGKELLDYCEKHQKVYHLYIFDIEMPGMDGVELAGKIRNKDKKAVFVFLTSYIEHVLEVFQVFCQWPLILFRNQSQKKNWNRFC